MLGGIDISALGILLAVVTSFGSYILGRRMRAKRAQKRLDKNQAAARAGETRQVRRARERREQEK
jgi:membrane protein DedA with SNARE-associated domain